MKVMIFKFFKTSTACYCKNLMAKGRATYFSNAWIIFHEPEVELKLME